MICQKIVELLFKVFTDWFELAGFLFGVACVYMAMRNHIINWPLAIISSLFYLIFFWNGRLFSDAGLQLVFVGTSIFGWVNWRKMDSGHASDQRISRLTHQEITQAAVITLMAWRAWYWLLPKLMPHSEALLLDTLTSESPSLSYEESNKLYHEVGKDFAHETSKYKQLLGVKNSKYFNALH